MNKLKPPKSKDLKENLKRKKIKLEKKELKLLLPKPVKKP